MEPIVAYQTSWLESTGVYGVQHNQAAEPNRHDPYELSFMHNEICGMKNAMLQRRLAGGVMTSKEALSTACCLVTGTR